MVQGCGVSVVMLVEGWGSGMVGGCRCVLFRKRWEGGEEVEFASMFGERNYLK